MSDIYSSAGKSPDSTATGYRKPRPMIDPWNKRFWEATNDGVLLGQQDEAGNMWFPPSPVSPYTRTKAWEWKALSGYGTVASWVMFHQKYFAGFGDTMPYNVAMVRLDEGPLIYTNVVELEDTALSIGMRVTVRFNPMDGTMQLPVFAPVREAAA